MEWTWVGEGAEGGVDGLSVVVRALRALPNPPKIPPTTACDRDRVADVLFDQAHRIDSMRLLYYVTALQIHQLDVLAAETCQREYFMLDTRDLAEQAVVRFLSSYLEGSRRKPFPAWARHVMLEVATRAAKDPGAVVPTFEEHAADDARLLDGLARIANPLPFEGRRIVWLAWIQRWEISRIAQETGVPVERVEAILESVLERAVELIRGEQRPKRRRPRRRSEEEGTEGAGDGI